MIRSSDFIQQFACLIRNKHHLSAGRRSLHMKNIFSGRQAKGSKIICRFPDCIFADMWRTLKKCSPQSAKTSKFLSRLIARQTKQTFSLSRHLVLWSLRTTSRILNTAGMCTPQPYRSTEVPLHLLQLFYLKNATQKCAFKQSLQNLMPDKFWPNRGPSTPKIIIYWLLEWTPVKLAPNFWVKFWMICQT